MIPVLPYLTDLSKNQTPADSAIALLSSSPEYAPTLPSVEHGVTPTDMGDLRALYGDLRQVIGTARTHGVRVVIDAEHTWFQVRRSSARSCGLSLTVPSTLPACCRCLSDGAL